MTTPIGWNAPTVPPVEGKRSMQRNGKIVGPFALDGPEPWIARCTVSNDRWRADGTYWSHKSENSRDLIAVVDGAEGEEGWPDMIGISISEPKNVNSHADAIREVLNFKPFIQRFNCRAPSLNTLVKDYYQRHYSNWPSIRPNELAEQYIAALMNQKDRTDD